MIRLGLAYLTLAIIVAVGIAGIPGFNGTDDVAQPLVSSAAPEAEIAPLTEPSAALTTAVQATLSVASQPETVPEVRPRPVVTGTTDLASMTAAILADLNGAAEEAVRAPKPTAKDEALAAMSIKALQGLRGTGDAAGEDKAALVGLVAQALVDGQTDAYIDALVNEAVGKGVAEAPSGLVTTEGRVDTAVLLASIVAHAQEEGPGIGEGDAPLPDVTPAGTAMMQYLATEDLLYTVVPGDSLGALALRFYGDASKYIDILSANTGRIRSPNDIRTGQKLVIPSLSKL
ncbi:LysM peptidoglycan-binding domain-containing protein [Thioclava sp. FR2]|uniref:LysM peptidoglycan-binding domain-containing protein n=1 Tax=Thioclava sp. FR2 TaxID=3445780 RepID=UPI003EB83984